jgi:type I restriction enzyme M protein
MEKNLSLEQKELIRGYIENSQKKIVKKIDVETRSVEYVDELVGRPRKNGDEELVRAYILTKLINELGYSINNIEIEHEYTAGRPHTNTSRIDIIVRDTKKDAFLFIEVKNPYEYETTEKNKTIEEQLFKVAGMEKAEGHDVKYLILYTIGFVENEINDECIIIDNEKFQNYKEWEESLDYLTDIPGNYGEAKKTPYTKGIGNGKDLETNFTNDMLSRLQIDLHNVLWGGGGTDDNDIFSSLTNLILAKIEDEDEKRDGEIYDFQTLSYESNDDLYKRINELYKRALKDKLNITDQKEIDDSNVVDTKKFSIEKVKYTVQALEKYSFVDGKNSLSGKDILGDFFEGIIRTGFKQTKGQFFTHINVVRFMLWGIQADRLAINKINADREIPYMIDPSAGSGTFLIEYMKFITKNIKYKFKNRLDTSRAVEDKFNEWFYPDNRENKWAREYIYGSELNFNLGTATKVNMILHGDGSTNIFVGAQKGDGLLPFNEYIKPSAPNALNKEFADNFYSKNVNEQFDLILTNPPFSVSLDNDTKKKLSHSFVFDKKKNTENLFIERYYQLLKPKGRMAIVLPESVFDTTENKYIRLFLFKYFNIKAIVSLPQLTFAPFTNTKTSILFAQKKTDVDMGKWEETWEKYANQYGKLKTRIENIKSVYLDGKDRNKYPSIKDLNKADEKNLLFELLNNVIRPEDKNLDIEDIINKYLYNINDLCTYDKDMEKELGFVNAWWVFNKVSEELNYEIFMAEADNVGYKRKANSIKPMPNDLYRTDHDNEVIVDDDVKEKILDYLRDISWE